MDVNSIGSKTHGLTDKNSENVKTKVSEADVSEFERLSGNSTSYNFNHSTIQSGLNSKAQNSGTQTQQDKEIADLSVRDIIIKKGMVNYMMNYALKIRLGGDDG